MTRLIQPNTCQQGIIRIYSDTGDYFGTGVLGLAGLAVTCSHVIRQALGLENMPSAAPIINGRVKVDFPFLELKDKFDVEVAAGGWGPEDGWVLKNDIAVLKLVQEPPLGMGYQFRSNRADVPIETSIYGFTREDLTGTEVVGTLKPVLNPLGLQVLDTEDSAFAASHGFSGGAIFPTDLKYGVLNAQGILIGNNDKHPLLKDGQDKRIVYIIPAERIAQQITKVQCTQIEIGEISEKESSIELIRMSRAGVRNLAQNDNDAGYFAEAVEDWLDDLEDLVTEEKEPPVERLETLVHYLEQHKQIASENDYNRHLTLLPLGNLCPKLSDLIQNITDENSEGRETLLIENDLRNCPQEYADKMQALRIEIRERLTWLKNNSLQLDEDKKEQAKATLRKLLHETGMPNINLIVLDNIRRTLQELDRTIFDELIMFSQLLLGKHAHRLKPGMVFRDTPDSPEMVMVPPGEFMMGSPEGEEGRTEAEGPQHKVTISKTLAVAIYTVTLGDFEKFVKETGYQVPNRAYTYENDKWEERDDRFFRNPGFEQAENNPVVCVNWNDAQAYINWLNGKTGKQYSLLSEAEWEYSCRAGKDTHYWWGNDITQDLANYSRNIGKTVPVDHYKPNPWGLYQMHGNIWEWCQDKWHGNYEGAPVDGSAWISSSANEVGGRVLRGGSWSIIPLCLRSAYRYVNQPTDRVSVVGFRISRTSFTS